MTYLLRSIFYFTYKYPNIIYYQALAGHVSKNVRMSHQCRKHDQHKNALKFAANRKVLKPFF